MSEVVNDKEFSQKVIYPDLSYKINGILFEVKKELGQYAREKQYGDLIAKRFEEGNILFTREVKIGDTGNILDFVVDNKVALELKASRFVSKDNYRQIQNYLQQSRLKLGILANFRDRFMKPIRVVRIDPDRFS